MWSLQLRHFVCGSTSPVLKPILNNVTNSEKSPIFLKPPISSSVSKNQDSCCFFFFFFYQDNVLECLKDNDSSYYSTVIIQLLQGLSNQIIISPELGLFWYKKSNWICGMGKAWKNSLSTTHRYLEKRKKKHNDRHR